MSTTEPHVTEHESEPFETEPAETEARDTEPAEREQDEDGRSWAGGAVVFFAVGVALRGLSHTDRFADGPLRHWYVLLAIVAAVTLVYHLGYRLVHRLTQHRTY